MSRLPPLLVANPLSGGGKTGRTLGDVHAVIERRLGHVDLALTSRPGHGIDLAREGVREGRETIIALGGDGTLHEVANGVLDAGGGAAVGYIGQGTGGDFRRTLGMRHRLDAYIEVIAAGRERPIDVGKLRYRAIGRRHAHALVREHPLGRHERSGRPVRFGDDEGHWRKGSLLLG